MPEAIPIHYVCTLDEARELCRGRDRFWVCNCGCREGKEGGCRRSRHDVCLMFSEGSGSSGPGRREIDAAEVESILGEAGGKGLVARPIRTEDRAATDGICFCCDDCCGYFLSPEEVCDKGRFVERTDMEACTHCGLCVDVCHFRARTVIQGGLSVAREKCYGCGLCAGACPAGCIEMVKRR